MSEDIYTKDEQKGENWQVYNGDNVEITKGIPDNSIHYMVYSPPFMGLYVYSPYSRDMGNCKSDDEFNIHFGYLSKELYRVLMPGRLMSVHCMNISTSKERDGYLGIKDFRGELIRIFERVGFIYHSEVCIWKDPVIAVTRTHALGLLHKQLKKDSCRCRQGIAEYVVTFLKPGDNPEPVTHTNESFPVEIWQNYASPTWTDINPSDTLQYKSARDEKDEKHICPLQLPVIKRCIDLWTNPGDVVFDPFAGIGSTGYVALQNQRKFVGIELKDSYYRQAVENLKIAEVKGKTSQSTLDIFDARFKK